MSSLDDNSPGKSKETYCVANGSGPSLSLLKKKRALKSNGPTPEVDDVGTRMVMRLRVFPEDQYDTLIVSADDFNAKSKDVFEDGDNEKNSKDSFSCGKSSKPSIKPVMLVKTADMKAVQYKSSGISAVKHNGSSFLQMKSSTMEDKQKSKFNWRVFGKKDNTHSVSSDQKIDFHYTCDVNSAVVPLSKSNMIEVDDNAKKANSIINHSASVVTVAAETQELTALPQKTASNSDRKTMEHKQKAGQQNFCSTDRLTCRRGRNIDYGQLPCVICSTACCSLTELIEHMSQHKADDTAPVNSHDTSCLDSDDISQNSSFETEQRSVINKSVSLVTNSSSLIINNTQVSLAAITENSSCNESGDTSLNSLSQTSGSMETEQILIINKSVTLGTNSSSPFINNLLVSETAIRENSSCQESGDTPQKSYSQAPDGVETEQRSIKEKSVSQGANSSSPIMHNTLVSQTAITENSSCNESGDTSLNSFSQRPGGVETEHRYIIKKSVSQGANTSSPIISNTFASQTEDTENYACNESGDNSFNSFSQTSASVGIEQRSILSTNSSSPIINNTLVPQTAIKEDSSCHECGDTSLNSSSKKCSSLETEQRSIIKKSVSLVTNSSSPTINAILVPQTVVRKKSVLVLNLPMFALPINKECTFDIHARTKTYEEEDCQQKLCFSNGRTYLTDRKEDEPFICVRCSMVCPNLISLRMHYNEQHNVRYLINYPCHVCGKMFERTQDLEDHLLLDHNTLYKCDTCDMEFLKESNCNYHKVDCPQKKKKTYVCEVCDMDCQNYERFKRHLSQHDELNTWICEFCGQGFAFQGLLNTHRKKHNKRKKYQCEDCGKSLTDKKALIMHLLKHRGIKKYTCEICGKKLASSEGYSSHLIAHKGPPPFMCDLCDKGYYSPSNLRNHKKDKHSISDLHGVE